ncbi:Uncharacterized protein CTYZ_00002645 [Cryptosporidium tyzzeri]|nr:Uncharacterized protein CTYZ_00002645 [Cryptosporidium tyzzeri]
MVAEKQQERHTNDKKRKFRRPFQRSPTNGAQKSSIGKEKDKIHNRYVSTNASTGGGLHDNHMNGNISRNSKDVSESSHEIISNHNGNKEHMSNNESRLNNNKHVTNVSSSNKNFSINNGGVKDQYYSTHRDNSDKGQHSNVTNNNSTYITGNDDNFKPSHAKNNKPEKIQPNHHQQQNHQQQRQHHQQQHHQQQHHHQQQQHQQQQHQQQQHQQQQHQQQQHQQHQHQQHQHQQHHQQHHQQQHQQQQHQQHQGQITTQHPKQVSQRQIPSNFQQKHHTYSSSSHNSHHEGRYNQDRRGRGYGYSGNRQHNHGGSSGGGYDLNRKQPLPSSNSGGGAGGTLHNSQSKLNQHNKSQQQFQNGPSNNTAIENTTNISSEVVATSTSSKPADTTVISSTTNTFNITNVTPHTTTTKEEGGKHYSSQNNIGISISRKDFHATPNRRGGDSHYYGYGRQHGAREHSNYHQHKDSIGKGVPHGGHQKDNNDASLKESRTVSHKNFSNGKPGSGAAVTTTTTVIGSESEHNLTTNVEQRQKNQPIIQQLPQAQSQKPSCSQQSNNSDFVAERKDMTKDDYSSTQKTNTDHNLRSNIPSNNHNQYSHNHNFSNNSGGSWKNQNGGDHTYGRHGRYSGPKNMGKGTSACNGGPNQNFVHPKHSTEGSGAHVYGQNAVGGITSEDLKKKKNKKRFNKNLRNINNPSGGTNGGQMSTGHQVGGHPKERPKYVNGDQQKTHNGDVFSSASPNENESKNISNKAQGGVTQHPSNIEMSLEKGKSIDSRKKLSIASNESDNTGSAKVTTGSDSMSNKLSCKGYEYLDGNNKSADFNININESSIVAEKNDLKTNRDIERREKLESSIPVSENIEGSSNNTGGSGNGNNMTPTSSSSSSNSNSNSNSTSSSSSSSSSSTSSSSTSGVVGPWRRSLHGGQTVDSLETVRRAVKSLLNKITVEKFTVIAEKLAVCIDEIKNVDELEELVKQVLDKAITEPDFSEMYADLCQILKWRSPVLVNKDGKSTIAFSKALLARCEQEFKNMPRNMTPTNEEREKYDSEELAILYRKRKLHVLGIIRLIGELFIRKMFPMRSLNELVFDLVMIQEKPDEYAVECLCQLIMTTGYYLDSNEKSQMIVDQWFGRLRELQNTSISTRLNCLIQDVFDLRKHKWVKKVHKQKAKALADILKDIDVEDVLGGAAIAAQYGSVVVVGERSNLVGNSAYYNYMTSQEELYISKQKSLQKQ